MAQWLKNPPAMQETQVQSLGQEDTLEKKMVTHSSILPGKSYEQRSQVGYSPWGCERIRHNLATKQQSQHIRRQLPLKRQIFTHSSQEGEEGHAMGRPPGEAFRVHQEAEKRGNLGKNFQCGFCGIEQERQDTQTQEMISADFGACDRTQLSSTWS